MHILEMNPLSYDEYHEATHLCLPVFDNQRAVRGRATGWTMARALGYDAGGRIVTQRINSAMRTYSYDLTDQLTNSTGASSYSATYDAVGNRTNADGRGYTVNNLNA